MRCCERKSTNFRPVSGLYRCRKPEIGTAFSLWFGWKLIASKTVRKTGKSSEGDDILRTVVSIFNLLKKEIFEQQLLLWKLSGKLLFFEDLSATPSSLHPQVAGF